jgi:hypothetical protein
LHGRSDIRQFKKIKFKEDMSITKEFEASIVSGERGRVSIIIPFDPKEAWGKQTRYHIAVQIGLYRFDTSLGSRDGHYFFPFNKEMQQQTGLKAGDTAVIAITLASSEETKSEPPEVFQQALSKNKKALDFFNGLSSFYRNTYIKWILAAKQEETQSKRIGETIQLLTEGKKQR